jgi:MtaA/CmuA family methyltransferase
MNGYERITAALKGEKPDKVPVMLHNFMLAAREHGITMAQYREDPRLIAECFIASVDRYGYDGILVDIDTVTLAGAVGVPVDFPPDDPARSHDGNINSLDDVFNLQPIKIENYRYVQNCLEAVRILKDYYKNEIFVRGNCDQAPFSLASMMRGAQTWMLDLMMGTEEQIEFLLEYCFDAGSQFIRLMTQTGCDMVSNGDSPAGPEMISSDMYVRYALPYEKRLTEIAHNQDVKYALHICGNTDVILEHMLKTGADAIDLDYKTDIRKIYDAFHTTTTLIGTIDPSGVLALGTPEEVREKSLELLNLYRYSNRFILNAGCAIPPTTPSVNIKTMIETARNFR